MTSPNARGVISGKVHLLSCPNFLICKRGRGGNNSICLIKVMVRMELQPVNCLKQCLASAVSYPCFCYYKHFLFSSVNEETDYVSPLRTPEIYLMLGDRRELRAQTWPWPLGNAGYHVTSLTESLLRPWREILHSGLRSPDFAQEWQIISPKSDSPIERNATRPYHHAPVTNFDSLSTWSLKQAFLLLLSQPQVTSLSSPGSLFDSLCDEE